VNAAGGVNGKKINLILLDDSAQPARAAANATRLITDEKVVLLLNASLSSTYAPVVGESQKSNTPLIFASSVCPKDVYPPANPLQFCTTAFAANYDSRAVLDFVKATAKAPVKLGLAAMAIPISRGEIDYAEGLAKTLGMTPVSKQIIPPPTADYTSFATLIKDADANWVYSWAPWVTQVRTLEGLRRLGWTGDYVAWSHLEAENELARLKDGKFYVIGANSLFQEDLPIHKEIAAAAKAANSQYPVNQMTEGWIAGMVIEAALKASGWPADAQKITAALSNLKVDTKGLRGGAIEWTKDNHFRTRQYYRVYRWDEAKGAIVRVRDWAAFDVK
jgi:branched-chain amino acid transport system substrate-binding protein